MTVTIGPESTAVRTALWRAMHVRIDAPPYVLEDEIGLTLVAPDPGWRDRPDMDPAFTAPFRASMVARARFVEDLVLERSAHGVGQYVILGAGLDSFAQRRPDIGAHMQLFEVDRPGPQAWKRQRLEALGLGVPPWLHLVPVDFEAGQNWWQALADNGFDAARPAIVASTGVSMYLTRDAIAATLRQVAALAPGTTLAMTFMQPLDLMPADLRPGLEQAMKGAAASGTPFISLFAPAEMTALAREAGFRDVRHVAPADLDRLYFADRPDGLRLTSGEEFLVAST
ncbi:MAG: class I SAM-dependent methyltransferase [Sphingomonas sp.]|nr:class I SAM-dependent methyltransferase [Sphingomonas sp.]MDX3884584.1 class I SAM-dependent methyltransferase [Sphingomonas sp.]